MVYVHWLFLAIYMLAIVGTMVTVLMDNRQPAKTMAWMLVLVFLPLVGIILYFFFGQNTRKERLISQQSLNQLAKRSMLEYAGQKDFRVVPEYESLSRMFANQNWSLPFQGNEVQIFTDGYALFHALLRDIAAAHHHIHLDTYIFEDDALGYMVADELIRKARQGIQVRVIYDDVGCWRVSSDFFERMRDEGVEVHPFMPVKFPAFTSKVNYRNHRKLCVIDGVTGYIGGMNIATRYVRGKTKKKKGEKPSHEPWRDTHLRIQGGGVYGIQHAFLVDWYFVDRTLITSQQYYPAPPPDTRNRCQVQIVTSSPIEPWPAIMQGYVKILSEAKQYVYIETPYFLPTEPVIFAMRSAVLAGVDVRLMIPRKSDARFVQWASRSYVHDIAEAGVTVYFYHAGFNHSKILVADDALCSCGSANVDFRSFENNFEGNAFIYDRQMAMRMKEVFLRDVASSERLSDVGRLRRRPYHKRLWESLVRLLSPLL